MVQLIMQITVYIANLIEFGHIEKSKKVNFNIVCLCCIVKSCPTMVKTLKHRKVQVLLG